MREFKLQDVLNAERQAAERIAKANAAAEAIRKSTEEHVGRINAETEERIASQRRERIEEAKRANEQAREKALQEAKETVAAWQARYEERREGIVDRLRRMLLGEEEPGEGR